MSLNYFIVLFTSINDIRLIMWLPYTFNSVAFSLSDVHFTITLNYCRFF